MRRVIPCLLAACLLAAFVCLASPSMAAPANMMEDIISDLALAEDTASLHQAIQERISQSTAAAVDKGWFPEKACGLGRSPCERRTLQARR